MPDRAAQSEGSSPFDPYHRWLAIRKDQRPPTYYQLLGVEPDESDREVIEDAALRQTSHIRLYQAGPHSQQATALLNELGQARATLLDPNRRRDYDARIGRAVPSVPPPVAPIRPVPREEVSSEGHAQGGVIWPMVGFVAVVCLGALLAFGLGLSHPQGGRTPEAATPGEVEP